MVSLDPHVGEYDEADIPIEDGEITEAGTRPSASNVDETVASDRLVVLGFADSHVHLAQTQVRRFAGDQSPIHSRPVADSPSAGRRFRDRSAPTLRIGGV